MNSTPDTGNHQLLIDYKLSFTLMRHEFDTNIKISQEILDKSQDIYTNIMKYHSVSKIFHCSSSIIAVLIACS